MTKNVFLVPAQVYYTVTLLAGNGSVTSGQIRSEMADRVIGHVYADQSGTLNIEWSADATNWDGVDVIDVMANVQTSIDLSVKSVWMRARYVNGEVAQTLFRLNIFLK